MTAPAHHHQRFASTTQLWYPQDTEELYQQHLKSRPLDLARLGHGPDNITYKFNSDGFRSEEFQQHSIVFLGCSITFGIGLALDSLFATKVAAALDLPLANLAVSGSSNDTAFRIAHYWLPRLRPARVILVSPQATRMELLTHQPQQYRVNSHSLQDRFYQQWLMNDQNSQLNQLKNQLAIGSICRAIGCLFDLFTVDQDVCTVEGDWARDLSHPGPASHAQTAQRILDRLC